MPHAQKGNALFLVLIGVVLFAALSMAVSSFRAGGSSNLSHEKGEILAGRILSFTSSLQAGVTRLSTINGVPAHELKYNNNVTTRFDETALALGALGEPDDPTLYVFHPKGGGVIPQKFEDAVTPCVGCGSTQVKSGHFNINWVLMPGIATEQSDLAVIVQDLHDDACLAINKRQGIDYIPNIIFGSGDVVQNSPKPPTNLTPSTGVTQADLDSINGKLTYCIKKTNPPVRNMFFSVIKGY